MKVCVIGNSHINGIKLAASSAQYADLDLDFYAVPGGGGPWFKFREGRMFAYVPPGRQLFTTIEGADRSGVDLSEYDAVVFSAVGMFPATNPMLSKVENHPLAAVRCPHWSPDSGGAASLEGLTLVSATVFDYVVLSYLRRAHTVQSAISVAAQYGGRMFWQAMPAPGVAVRDDAGWKVNALYGAKGPLAWYEFFQAQNLGLRQIASEAGQHVAILEVGQPVEGGFMKEAFSAYDHWHGSRMYGELTMEALIAALGDAPIPAFKIADAHPRS
jgi:hypothetical protein